MLGYYCFFSQRLPFVTFYFILKVAAQNQNRLSLKWGQISFTAKAASATQTDILMINKNNCHNTRADDYLMLYLNATQTREKSGRARLDHSKDFLPCLTSC